MNYDLDLCDNEKCQFSGLCKRFVPYNKLPQNAHPYYLTGCTNYIYFISK